MIFNLRFINADGTGRHTVMEGVPHPFAIALFEDWMYWSDWNHMTIERAHKYTGDNHSVLVNVTHRPMDVHIYHPLKQRPGERAFIPWKSSLCAVKNKNGQ